MPAMNREKMLESMKSTPHYEFLVIGGGASGLGIAVDAVSRGYNTILFESVDFAKGTSSRSTKLVHGGVRYLAQGNIKLVKEALRERGLLSKNAPHLFRNLDFVIPNYDRWGGIFYGVGLKVYDLLSGRLSLGKSKLISVKKVRDRQQRIHRTYSCKDIMASARSPSCSSIAFLAESSEAPVWSMTVLTSSSEMSGVVESSRSWILPVT